MTLTDHEEEVLEVFAEMEIDHISNNQLREITGLDEFAFVDALNSLEKRGFIERYVGKTVLLTKGSIYLRKKMDTVD
jgi:DNA-binding MarR family transcriptional regulator